jgi:hypothetical protein
METQQHPPTSPPIDDDSRRMWKIAETKVLNPLGAQLGRFIWIHGILMCLASVVLAAFVLRGFFDLVPLIRSSLAPQMVETGSRSPERSPKAVPRMTVGKYHTGQYPPRSQATQTSP